jgi:hypothetical protein
MLRNGLCAGLAGFALAAATLGQPLPSRQPSEQSATTSTAKADGEAEPIAAEKPTNGSQSASISSQDTGTGSFFPKLDFYFPEGQMDLRVQNLIKNAYYAGQVRYDFVNGDISAFLRYRYYGYKTVYQIGVFDEIEFENLQKLSNDFTRTRGSLLLLQWPHNYHSRSYLLAELDSYTSNKEEFRFSTNRTNTFLRLGHQLGTPNDRRSNAIVGETRAFTEQLFTPHQKIGPHATGVTGALTWAFDSLGGDFRYVKAEGELVKRFELPRRSALIGRLHAGTFPYKRTVRSDPQLDPLDLLSIPRAEYFRLDGRDNLKGVDERLRGTDQILTTWEYFIPWFLGDERRALGARWQNWYWIAYAGAGTIGLDHSVLTDFNSYIPDVGIGFESSIRVRNYTFFLAGVVARALDETGGLKARLSVKSYH